MTKLVKQKYYTSTGEAKVNCYRIMLTKEQIKASEINEDDDLEIKTEKNKIVIEKKEG